VRREGLGVASFVLKVVFTSTVTAHHVVFAPFSACDLVVLGDSAFVAFVEVLLMKLKTSYA
jgi:hypothetical protein